ncbi:MAG: IS4 family transposase [Shewanella xiamenensis]|nr:IS4 family transposase [Shewanella xiamenensis]
MSIFNVDKWAKNHFNSANLGDPRRTQRVIKVATDMARCSGKSIALSCKGNEVDVEGAYRLIRNDNVSPEAIRAAGFRHTAELAQSFSEILAIDDTTSLSYRHQVAEDLGKLGTITDKSRGWWVHSTLLLDRRTTQTIGLIHQDYWLRPDAPEDADEKESGKWADAAYFSRQCLGDTMSRVIAVCDREADILSYIQDKQKHHERFVIRAKHARKIMESEATLFEHLESQPELGAYTIDIAQKGTKDHRGKAINRAARKAHLSVKVAQVTLKTTDETQPINVVYAQEKASNKENEPLRWVLLTTEPIASLAQALNIIDIYTARWRIEDFHKAWKTGAGAERQRMTEPRNLERAVSILAFIGVRLLQLRESMTIPYYLRKKGLIEAARCVEEQGCDTVLEEDEWRLLMRIHKPRGHKDKGAPSLKWAYQSIAKLGGFTDTKRTGIASWGAMWEGWNTLQSHVVGYRTAKDMLADGEIL